MKANASGFDGEPSFPGTWLLLECWAELSEVWEACQIPVVRFSAGPWALVFLCLRFSCCQDCVPSELPQFSSLAHHIEVVICVQCHCFLRTTPTSRGGVVLEDDFINHIGTTWPYNFHFPTICTTFYFNLTP